MKCFILILGILTLLSGSAIADYPPDWGYDYIVRSLRTELYRDSTYEAGWVYLDSITARYAIMDSLAVTSVVGTNLDLSGWLSADSIDVRAISIDTLYGSSPVIIMSPMVFDSAQTVSFSGTVDVDTVYSEPLHDNTHDYDFYGGLQIDNPCSFNAVSVYVGDRTNQDPLLFTAELWSSSGGSPYAMVACSDTVGIAAVSCPGWVDFTFDQLQYVSSEMYIVGHFVGSSGQAKFYDTNTGGSGYSYWEGTVQGGASGWSEVTNRRATLVLHTIATSNVWDIVWDDINKEIDLPEIHPSGIITDSSYTEHLVANTSAELIAGVYLTDDDSLLVNSDKYMFYLRQTPGAAGDRDMGMIFVEEDLTEWVILCDEGANRYEFDHNIQATAFEGSITGSSGTFAVSTRSPIYYGNPHVSGDILINPDSDGTGIINAGNNEGDSLLVQTSDYFIADGASHFNNGATFNGKTTFTLITELNGEANLGDLSLTNGAKVDEFDDGRLNSGVWTCTITHDSLSAVAVAEDVLMIDDFPAKYKIVEVFIDVREVWDDAAGPMSACTISLGWTAANYDDLMQIEDIYTAITQLGDAAGEINYTAVQGGIRPSWSAGVDIYLRFVATGANLSTLTTGEMTVYVTYQSYGCPT